MAEQKAVVAKEDPILKMLMTYQKAITSMLPKHLTPERMLRIAHTMISRTPKLRECNMVSLINSVVEISILGLEIGRTAHIVPFKNEATVIVDYKGYIELAHRSNQIASLPFKPVYENDIFDYTEGTERYIKHKPATKDRGELIAAYAIANFKSGGFDFEVVLPPDIEATRKRAPGARFKDSPWNDPDMVWTMWCKTAVRRLAKRIPQCPELQRAAYLDELAEAGLKQGLSHVATDAIDAEFRIADAIEEEKPVQKEAVSSKIAQMKLTGQVSATVACPESDGRDVPAEKCNACDMRQGCPSHS